MGACFKGRSFVPVKVVEFDIPHLKVFICGQRDTSRTDFIDLIPNGINIIGSTDDQSSIKLGFPWSIEIGFCHFNVSSGIVCSLEVNPSDITHSFSNGCISSTLPTSKVTEICGDSRILPIRILVLCLVWLCCIRANNFPIR